MIKIKKLGSIASAALMSVWIGAGTLVQSAFAQDSDGAAAFKENVIPAGEGQFRLIVKRGPVNVFTYRPRSFTPDSPIWIVMHGESRGVADHSSFDYYDVWAPLAEQAGALLLVPEFVEQSWPTSWQYQFGNIRTSSLAPIPWEDTGFAVIETAFHKAVSMTGSHRKHFSIYGHSAGAQFVQRYILQTGGRLVDRAVAANAGWYLLPDDEFEFPYGLKGSPIPQATLRSAFATDVVVLLGQNDRLKGGVLRNDEDTREQGRTRFERGHFYFDRAAADARRMGAQFAWHLEEVPNAGHDNAQMAPAAAPLLMGSRPVNVARQ